MRYNLCVNFESIIKSIKLSFIWKGNKKKTTIQKGGRTHVAQERGITNVFNIENFTVNGIHELAGAVLSDSPDTLLQSAGKRLLVEQAYKQANLKDAVLTANLDSIKAPQQLDKDWFFKWMSAAEEVSRKDMQEVLGKILAGEVKRSNTFSIRTLDIVKNLTKTDVELFQKLCDISFSLDLEEIKIEGDVTKFVDKTITVITEAFGSPGSNSLKPFGLGYAQLCILQEAGLIQNDLTAWSERNQQFFLMPFKIGAKKLRLDIIEKKEPDPSRRLKVVNFTEAGWELRNVFELGINNDYIDKFTEWLETTFSVK